jgi:hypothetical protein
MFLDQLQVELHLYFGQEHVNNKKVEFGKLELSTKLTKNSKLKFLPPPTAFESVIIILSITNMGLKQHEGCPSPFIYEQEE